LIELGPSRTLYKMGNILICDGVVQQGNRITFSERNS
jgi:hypothetical protein